MGFDFHSYDIRSSALRPLVRSAWTMSYTETTGYLPGLIAPDAHVEFVFNLGSPPDIGLATTPRPRPSPRAMIYAQRLGLLRLQSTGDNAVVAFRVPPAVASAILHRSLADCWDRPVALTDLIGRDGEEVAEKVSRARPSDRGQILEAWIGERLGDWSSDDARAHAAQNALMSWEGATASAADRFGMAERTLRRRCAAYSGLSPKQLVNSGRILRACLLLRDGAETSIAEIAAYLGFGDQAALTNAFRKHTGTTPAQFRAEPLVFCERPEGAGSAQLAGFCKTGSMRTIIPVEDEFGDDS